MTKIEQTFLRLADMREKPVKVKPDPDTLMASVLSDTMRSTTGYEPVSIELLRNDPGILRLLDMLETCRPGGSPEEEDFIKTYLHPLDACEDQYGNQIVEVPIPEGYPRILWSCHTDSVHRHGGTQRVEVKHGFAWTPSGSCLGADDGVGVWLAIEMIRAKVPGVYVFHREEESGGGGSLYMARNHSKWLGECKAAIALDRMGYADVITYQGGARCCSDAFAASLAKLLGGRFRGDDSGVFTDTANYTDVIGECTNLSVGYFRQHGPTEHLDLGFAYRLRDALIAADWTKLEFERQPGEVEEVYAIDWRDYRSSYGSFRDSGYGYSKRSNKGVPDGTDVEEMEQFVFDNAWAVAEYLIANRISAEDIEAFAYEEEGL
jgi:hypothetical protein